MPQIVKYKQNYSSEQSEVDYRVRYVVQRMYNKSAPMMIVESILFIVAGIYMLINPMGVLTIVAFIFGCVLILIGFYRAVSGFIVSHEYGGGWPDVLAGLVNIIIGVLFLICPFGSSVGLVYVFIVLFVF